MAAVGALLPPPHVQHAADASTTDKGFDMWAEIKRWMREFSQGEFSCGVLGSLLFPSLCCFSGKKIKEKTKKREI